MKKITKAKMLAILAAVFVSCLGLALSVFAGDSSVGVSFEYVENSEGGGNYVKVSISDDDAYSTDIIDRVTRDSTTLTQASGASGLKKGQYFIEDGVLYFAADSSMTSLTITFTGNKCPYVISVSVNDTDYTGTVSVSHTAGEAVDAKEATCGTAGSTGNVYCSVCGELLTEAEEIAATGVHSYGEAQSAVAATCTSAGSSEGTICQDCGYSTIDTIDALGHDWKVSSYTWAEDGSSCSIVITCANDETHVVNLDGTADDGLAVGSGGRYYVSSVAGASYTAVETAATCTEDAYTTYTVSGSIEITDKPADTTSVFELTETAANESVNSMVVTEEGTAGHVWSATGYEWSNDGTECTVVISCANVESHVAKVSGSLNSGFAVGNGGGLYKVTSVTASSYAKSEEVDPTCTEAGYVTYAISGTVVLSDKSTVSFEAVSDEYETEAATGHTLEAVEAVAPTCTEAGHTAGYGCSACDYTEDIDEIEATGHEYSVAYDWSEDGRSCTVTIECDNECGYKVTINGEVSDNAVASIADDEEETTTTYPFTNSSTGKYHASNLKNATYTAEVTDATCIAYGYVTYTIGGSVELDNGDIVDLENTMVVDGDEYGEHEYESVVTEPTCTEAGYTTYTCSVCDNSYTGDEVEANGHSYVGVVTDPTCTKEGYTTYTCSVCDDSYTADTVEASGHKYSTEVTEPTCTEGGYTTYTCSVCNDVTVGSETDALGHDYEATVVTATCDQYGYTLYTCSRCGDYYIKECTDPNGHSYEGVVTDPTCEKDGYTTYTCPDCGDSYTADAVEALGHSYDDGVVTAEATTEAAGQIVYTCNVCESTYVEAIPKLEAEEESGTDEEAETEEANEANEADANEADDADNADDADDADADEADAADADDADADEAEEDADDSETTDSSEESSDSTTSSDSVSTGDTANTFALIITLVIAMIGSFGVAIATIKRRR